MFSNSEQARNGKSPPQGPLYPKGKCCFRVTLLPGPLPILLLLGSCVPAAVPKMPKINLEYWQSYEDLEECMEPVKNLSLFLESSKEPTIHSTFGYFLRLLYERLETSPKRHIAACTRDVCWSKFVGTGKERNSFPFKKDLSLSPFFHFFPF